MNREIAKKRFQVSVPALFRRTGSFPELFEMMFQVVEVASHDGFQRSRFTRAWTLKLVNWNVANHLSKMKVVEVEEFYKFVPRARVMVALFHPRSLLVLWKLQVIDFLSTDESLMVIAS